MSGLIEGHDNSSTSNPPTLAMPLVHYQDQPEMNISDKSIGKILNDLKLYSYYWLHILYYILNIYLKFLLQISHTYHDLFIAFQRRHELLVMGHFLPHKARYTRVGVDINVCDICNNWSVWYIQQLNDHCGVCKNQSGKTPSCISFSLLTVMNASLKAKNIWCTIQ